MPTSSSARAELPWAAITVALVSIVIVSIDGLMLPILFSAIQDDMDATAETTLGWVFSGYTITVGALSVVAGRFGDRTGRRRVFVTGLALWTFAAFSAALAPNAEMLIAARVLQGAAHAMLTPSSIGLLLGMTDARHHTRLLAVWVGTGSVAGAIAPVLGALIAAGPGWRFAFLMSGSIAATTLIPAIRLLPETARHDDVRIPDPVGSVTLAAILASITFVIYQGRRWGWLDLRISVAIALVVVLVPLFWRRARSHPVPAIDVALFRFRSFRRGMLVSFTISSALAANLFLVTQLNSDIFGYSVLESGLALTPMAIAATAAAMLAPAMARRGSLGGVALAGIGLAVLGWSWMAFAIDWSSSYALVELPTLMLVGFGGWGLVLPTLNALTMSELPAGDYSTGSAIYNTVRQVANGLGIAVVFGFVASDLDLDRYRTALFAMAASGLAAAAVAAQIRRTVARELTTAVR